MSEVDTAVIFKELTATGGFKIAVATLTKPASLNALDLQMINLLTPQLEAWQQDPQVAMVFLDGSGDRAFCAGGDIVSMYRSMQQSQQQNESTANVLALQEFFTQEYRLDHLIHSFEKPILVWGNGIIMGGGLGLMSGASHRIVTETSRIAMPEISIGLYPDVGGSYFLNAMPPGCGLFLGLTGASINAADALYSNLADYYMPQEAKQGLMDKLLGANWQVAEFAQTLSDICLEVQTDFHLALPKSNLKNYQDKLGALAHHVDVSQAVKFILALDSADDKWLSKAQKTLQAGSPITAHLVFEQLQRGKNMTLAECFQMELGMSCQCGEYGEFQEGVRALMIDKDNQPNWRFKSVEQVPSAVVDYFFDTIWSQEAHPLAQLGLKN
ncbi:enoyl-CoA hydratase/isomerase family protein [uncultured Paraglaciecola sp.]|uniref:enoyl-CoA hydratase/isomerase family protein n=1 Tax=uncultured Paraglaciecola sp. TaxID=1765024 RepID=UPI00261F2B7A|nr:enoyl-CoA hydratase/isomerase family protein [uncultured Paraglaciecola sp.]